MPDLYPATGSVFLSGTVAVDDGSELTEAATIQSICGGQRRTQAYTDRKGRFSFEFGNRTNGPASAAVADVTTSSMSSSVAPREWQGCQLQAVLPGFTSDIIELSQRLSRSELSDVGRIVLHRLGSVEGATLSATTAAAPPAAKKAFEKGRKELEKKDLAGAKASFQKAVGIYPRHAPAWFELGRLQLESNELDAARTSFNQSLAADNKYANPYQGLGQIALREQKWQDLVDVTGKLLALNPVNFPDAWFFNAVGNYQLHNLDAAEKSARRAVSADTEHHYPKVQYLLGLVLMQKQDYPGAMQSMQQYLQMAKAPADVSEAQKQLENLKKLTASASAAPAPATTAPAAAAGPKE